MYEKILVPLDGSAMAECSLAHVKAIASGCNTHDVILIEAVEPITNESLQFLSHTGRDPLEAEEQNRVEAKNYLEGVSERLKSEGLPTKLIITDGHPDKTILEYAVDNNVDLIIMSTHGRSGASRWFYGSVADKIVKTSSIPVMLITPDSCRI